MKKLPVLIASTSMLVCGEDLGMIPECVPSVMNELQILSLEIERMPKVYGVLFEPLESIPYMSVCTTSTHDMAPVRVWWKENKDIRFHYYHNVLGREGNPPDECTSDICRQIIENHLKSPAMLTIIPFQDWLSIDDNIKRANENEERINVPSIPDYYWKYRMHITLEELINADNLNENIRDLNRSSGR